MYTPLPILNYRFALAGLLLVALLSLFGCSSTPTRPTNLSKIFVEHSSSPALSVLPSQHTDARYILELSLKLHLSKENRLQEDRSVHALTLRNIILSYQSGSLTVQADLFDDDHYLAYSRIVRPLAINEDWQQALNEIARQLLDELVVRPENTLTGTTNVTIYQDYYDSGYYRRMRNRPSDYPYPARPERETARPTNKPYKAPKSVVDAIPETHTDTHTKAANTDVRQPLSEENATYLPPSTHPIRRPSKQATDSETPAIIAPPTSASSGSSSGSSSADTSPKTMNN